MIFVGGIHGVGKSYFTEKVKKELNIDTYQASKLISDLKNECLSNIKLVSDIDRNQNYLLKAIDKLDSLKKEYLLDGHFCLLNEYGNVEKIENQTYRILNPDAVILITEEPEIIVRRRLNRDGVISDIKKIKEFQDHEINYAKEITGELGIPLYISMGSDITEESVMFIKKYIVKNRGELYGREI